ncbi:hypothetical protein [Prosthecobacter sp.]|uniref:hypothetical protein n=1 Tax=Prosthecobacter sp. TaxID=1965333 RepID=UPI0037838D61
MKMLLPFAGMLVTLLVLAPSPLQAKDEIRLSYPSKVEGSKAKEREKLFTPWMSSEELQVKTEEKRSKGEQLIYFEYNNATGQSRAIYLSNFKLEGPYSRWSFTSEPVMEAKLNSEMKAGLQPAFVVRTISGAFTMLFVSPQDMAAVRQELAKLGIGEPRLKK